MSTVATTERPEDVLTLAVEAARTGLEGAVGDVATAIATARGMKAIKAALTDEVMTDFMELYGSAHGFKADRPNKNDSSFYTKEEVRNCLIDAFLKGARVVGNEINIIAGQCYLAKEFYDRKIKSLGYVADLKFSIGAATQHGPKTAVMSGKAAWIDKRDGQQHLVDFANTEEGDFRIVVNAHGANGPDALYGKGEKKLLQRIYKQMTGIDISSEPGMVEGAVVSGDSPKLEKKTANIEQDKGTNGERATKAAEAFSKFKVTHEMIVTRISRPLADATAEDVEWLSTVYKALDKGESRAADIFEFPEVTEAEIRTRFGKLKTKAGIDKAADEFIAVDADEDMVGHLATEYSEALKGGE